MRPAPEALLQTTDRNKAAGCPVMGRTSQEVGVMPKEIITSKYEGMTDPDGKVVPEPIIHVGWSREPGHVELATRAGGDYDEVDEHRPGIFAQLDRAGINRLIRALRKARDAAYGADA